ncbi:hypothetical protein UAO_01709 [Enterococcus villorum ATCC 700913]|jgi:hypothetical protein|uniref:Uncharacterized protein n=1 Tax=Enterococcus villorum ATCC 700913 TaxID=1158604 RepID=A0ABP2UQ64_9ENTE|nr:hypothetical protein UAO_01709 [Enterococcus villorum ATCC 700913]EOW76244.1 hypothetical protein I591_01546 [Enterococcus villorum ATCC 700913]
MDDSPAKKRIREKLLVGAIIYLFSAPFITAFSPAIE